MRHPSGPYGIIPNKHCGPCLICGGTTVGNVRNLSSEARLILPIATVLKQTIKTNYGPHKLKFEIEIFFWKLHIWLLFHFLCLNKPFKIILHDWRDLNVVFPVLLGWRRRDVSSDEIHVSTDHLRCRTCSKQSSTHWIWCNPRWRVCMRESWWCWSCF